MTAEELVSLTSKRRDYNLHSHTEYCDGRVPMSVMTKAAIEAGYGMWGFTPHSPAPVESGCNMLESDVARYIDNLSALQEQHADKIRLLCGMEVDFLGRDFGPHIDYFHKLPLEYRIGSVHFVPNQEGRLLDCDGRFERFSKYLKAGYNGDLRYVVEKYFEQVLTMLELGGFEILGHFDKIIGNASQADPTLEDQKWYVALIDDVISKSKDAGVIVEINTKAFEKSGRFYPSEKWWEQLQNAKIPIAINTDCHEPELINVGRDEAFFRMHNVQSSK